MNPNPTIGVAAHEMAVHGLSLIAGGTGRPGPHTFRAINPASGEALAPEFTEAAPGEIVAALDAAMEAFEDYRTRPPEKRARLLESIAAHIERLGDNLLRRTHLETGLPPGRLQVERARTCGQLRLFAQVVRDGSWVDARIDRAQPERQPAPRLDIRRMLIPVGPVVVFGSSNFPLAFSVAGGDSASALAAGCPVVVKANRAHPGTSEMVGRALAAAVAECGMPAGLFSLIHGGGATVGIALVQNPSTAAVGFTGSLEAGKALCRAAAARARPIPVFAEMSSLNPVFLLDEALDTRGPSIARDLFASFTLGVGQFCTKPGLVFVQAGAATDAFLHSLASHVRNAASATMLTPDICHAFTQNRERVTKVPGVTIMAVAGVAANAGKVQGCPSVAVAPARIFLAERDLATEAFGPFTLVVIADSREELLECARKLDGQLTAAVHGSPGDLARASRLLAILQQVAGRIIFNGFPTGVEVSPAMNHGGPYPATSDSRFTSVGTAAVLRFARPVCYQGAPAELLPPELRDENPLQLLRLIDGRHTRDSV